MRIDSATPPMGFAQNDSITRDVEISNGNERRIQSCTSGENSTQLDLPLFAAYEDLRKPQIKVNPVE